MVKEESKEDEKIMARKRKKGFQDSFAKGLHRTVKTFINTDNKYKKK